MQITLIAIQNHPPAWANSGYDDYAKRLPKDYRLNLITIPALKRGKNAPIQQILDNEGQQIIKAIPKGDLVIALDRKGDKLSTQSMATQLLKWHDNDQNISLLIGGPEGLSEECLRHAQRNWSLSDLTLPHPLVKVVVAEQLYRAWSIISGHPYHR